MTIKSLGIIFFYSLVLELLHSNVVNACCVTLLVLDTFIEFTKASILTLNYSIYSLCCC